MKIGRLAPLAVLVLVAPAASALADDKVAAAPRQPIALRVGRSVAAEIGLGPQSKQAVAAAYSVELPQIGRLPGANNAFYRTAVDITNNTTNGGVTATIQYSYANAACANGFCRTQPLAIALAALDSFHTDDIVQYLDQNAPAGPLVQGAVDNSVGTLLINFTNLVSANGWEATAVARLYTRVDENNPALGTIGYAYPASLFFESAHETSVGIARDTSTPALAGGTQGSQRTNIGVRNTDIHVTNQPVSVLLTFYDVTEGSPTNGQRVGNTLAANNLLPGQVAILGNVFALAAIPDGVSQCIVFVDVNPAPTVFNVPTIESFIVTIDNITNDGSYYDLKCGDSNAAATCGR